MKPFFIGVGWCMLLLALRPCPAQAVLSPGSTQAKQQPAFPLAKAKSARFQARFWCSKTDAGSTYLLQGQTFRVEAVRPDRLHIEDISRPENSTSENSALMPFSTFIANGRRMLETRPHPTIIVDGETLPLKPEYVLARADGPLEKLHGKFHVPDRIINADILFDPRTPNDPTFPFAFLQNDTLNGEAVAVYTREFTSGDTLIRHRMSLSAKTGLPVRISTYTQQKGQALIEDTRVDYMNWELNIPLPDSEFNPTPPRGSRPYR